jgi:hypothetical protein
MSYQRVLCLFLSGVVGSSVASGCAAGSSRDEYAAPAAPGGSSAEPPLPEAPPGAFEGPSVSPPPDTNVPEVHEVFGHSKSTLFRLEPKTKAVSIVGNFKDCEPVTDIALNESSDLYAVSNDTLYTVDKTTAACSKVSQGTYPNSLSFVPKGTLLENEEALVGYDEGDYVRIDIKTGTRTIVGKLGGNLVSSGDIVSVKGGSTYLTVKSTAKSGDCTTTDCLVEVDPKTGKMLKNWGSVEHKKVFGLSFWGGKVYGFDETGNLFEVVFGSNKVVTTTIQIPQKPTGLSFWGAGSSTSAPLVAEPD